MNLIWTLLMINLGESLVRQCSGIRITFSNLVQGILSTLGNLKIKCLQVQRFSQRSLSFPNKYPHSSVCL